MSRCFAAMAASRDAISSCRSVLSQSWLCMACSEVLYLALESSEMKVEILLLVDFTAPATGLMSFELSVSAPPVAWACG